MSRIALPTGTRGWGRAPSRWRRRDVLFGFRAAGLELVDLATGQPISFSRASPGGLVPVLGGSGASRGTVLSGPHAHNVPRFAMLDRDGDGSPETPALMLEGSRTNLVEKPKFDVDSDGNGLPDGVSKSAHADYTVTPLSLSGGVLTFRVDKVAETGGWGGGIRIDIPGIVQGDVLSSGVDIFVQPGSPPLTGTRYFWEYTNDATGTLVQDGSVSYPADGQWHRLFVENMTIANPVRGNSFKLIVRTGKTSDPIGGSTVISIRRPQMERGPFASSFTVGTRAHDAVTSPWPYGPATPVSVYARWCLMHGLMAVPGIFPRLWSIGGNSDTAAAVGVHFSSTGGLVLKVNNGAANTSKGLVVSAARDQEVELLTNLYVDADGKLACALTCSVDRGPATSTSGALVAAPAAWTAPALYINGDTLAGHTGFIYLLDFFVLYGAGWTMDAARRVAGVA